MKIIEHKARDVKSGETILDRSTRFIIKEVRVNAEHGLIAFVDMEGVWHGVYHPDEYLGLGESIMTREETKRRLDELAREYCATHNPNIVEELYRLARELEKMDKNEGSSQW